MIDALKLAQDLIRCPSVTPVDAGALGVLRDALAPHGFTGHDLPFGVVQNLYARAGTSGPHLCFAGHTDVVPPGDATDWTHPPFAAEIADGILYGRGTVDMKGAIACFAAAAAAFIEKHGLSKGSISFLITGDEEGPAVDGTLRVLDWLEQRGEIPDFTLVGEPTNDTALGEQVHVGRRGSLNAILTVRGTQGHVAYPDRADNPMPRVAALQRALLAHVFDEGSVNFQPTNLEITSQDTGNFASNVIPAMTSLRFNIRFGDRWTRPALEAEVRRVLDSVNAPYEIDFFGNAEAFVTKHDHYAKLLQGAVQDVTGRTPALTTSGGTSDARFISRLCPVMEFGLRFGQAHKVDEHVALDELALLTRIYGRFLERFFLESDNA